MARVGRKTMQEKATLEGMTQDNVESVKKISENQFVLCAKENTELRLGRIKVDTDFILDAGRRGVITSLHDNVRYGLRVNDDIRLLNSDIIPCVVRDEEISVYIKVNDNTLYSYQTAGGTKTQNCFIPKGMPIAILTLL